MLVAAAAVAATSDQSAANLAAPLEKQTVGLHWVYKILRIPRVYLRESNLRVSLHNYFIRTFTPIPGTRPGIREFTYRYG